VPMDPVTDKQALDGQTVSPDPSGQLPVTASYSQSRGEIHIIGQDGTDTLLAAGCWAGCGKGKNDPEMQHVRLVGPLPRGWYHIGEPETASTGPFSLRLMPAPGTDMFGRDSFLIHGAAKDPDKRGEESHGCIVAPRAIREAIHARGIQWIQVVK